MKIKGISLKSFFAAVFWKFYGLLGKFGDRLVKYGQYVAYCKNAKNIIQEQSYYPEETRKPEKERYQENVEWIKKYREVNMFYNLYGFDVHPVDESYLDDESFRRDRNRLNKKVALTL